MSNHVLTQQQALKIEQDFLEVEERARQAALARAEEKGRQEESTRIRKAILEEIDKLAFMAGGEIQERVAVLGFGRSGALVEVGELLVGLDLICPEAGK